MVSEIEKQRKVVYGALEKNPEFTYTIFNTKKALESQRASNYKNSARAAREIIDNAIEAGGAGTSVYVLFETYSSAEAPRGRRGGTIKTIYFLDDAGGMFDDKDEGGPSMIRYSLTWGGGIHTDDEEHEGIGKFGFGLPNSSISQCKKTSVYSSENGKDWFMGLLDIDKLSDSGAVEIPETKKASLPKFVRDWAKKNGVEIEAGTCVVWDDCDRLTRTTVTGLKEQMDFDFAMTYRDYLQNINLCVNGTQPVSKIDPLFLDKDAKYFVKPIKNLADNDNHDEGGSRLMFEKTIGVKYWRDANTGLTHLSRLDSPDALADAKKQKMQKGTDLQDVAIGNITVKVCRLPYGFALDNPKVEMQDEDSKRRLNIRTYDTGYHFVRAGREIEVTDCAPSSARDKSKSLGDWIRMQAYSAHYPVEFRFDPTLDMVFNVGHDKQHVAPIDEFWAVMTEIGVDARITIENQWRVKVGAKKSKDRANSKKVLEPSVKIGRKIRILTGITGLPKDRKEAKKAKVVLDKFIDKKIKEEVKELQKRDKITISEAEKKIESAQVDRPFLLEYSEIPGGSFMTCDYGLGDQIVVTLNKQHSFYTEIFSGADLSGKNGIFLMLQFLAQKELVSITTDPKSELSKVLPTLREELGNWINAGLKEVSGYREEEEV